MLFARVVPNLEQEALAIEPVSDALDPIPAHRHRLADEHVGAEDVLRLITRRRGEGEHRRRAGVR
jgi:hypothetical protein